MPSRTKNTVSVSVGYEMEELLTDLKAKWDAKYGDDIPIYRLSNMLAKAVKKAGLMV